MKSVRFRIFVLCGGRGAVRFVPCRQANTFTQREDSCSLRRVQVQQRFARMGYDVEAKHVGVLLDGGTLPFVVDTSRLDNRVNILCHAKQESLRFQQASQRSGRRRTLSHFVDP